jgi:hypothetical protein
MISSKILCSPHRPDVLREGCGRAVVKKGIVMAGKYTPLENYLRDLPESQREVTLRFEQIERILNFKLPPSAYESRAWWANEKEGAPSAFGTSPKYDRYALHHHSNFYVVFGGGGVGVWSNAGWKVESLDFNEKWVKLVRAG